MRKHRVAPRAEWDARVNEMWRQAVRLRNEVGSRAADEAMAEWAEGRTPAEVAALIRARLADWAG